MLIGQTVLAPGTGEAVYYSPWVPRQGNDMTANIEVIEAMTPFNLTYIIETKNAEDADSSAAPLTGTGSLTATGTDSLSVSGAKELVRIKFALAGDSVGRSDTWIHFRSNPFIWQPN